MARLSVHGQELARIQFTTYSKVYSEDGTILKNYGDGWKIAGKVKAGVSPQDAARNAQRRQAEFLEARPAFVEYRRALHDLANAKERPGLHYAVTLLHDDPDGLWSEVCDGLYVRIHADISEICDLCDKYNAALQEQNGVENER